MAKKELTDLYKHRERKSGFDPMTSGEFFSAIFYQVPSSVVNEQCPEGEWYCTNEECVVREVTVYCKLFGETLPEMSCPACKKRLKFHHWLEVRTLVPVEVEGRQE